MHKRPIEEKPAIAGELKSGDLPNRRHGSGTRLVGFLLGDRKSRFQQRADQDQLGQDGALHIRRFQCLQARCEVPVFGLQRMNGLVIHLGPLFRFGVGLGEGGGGVGADQLRPDGLPVAAHLAPINSAIGRLFEVDAVRRARLAHARRPLANLRVMMNFGAQFIHALAQVRNRLGVGLC